MNTPWQITTAPPSLGEDEIHVWRASLNASPAHIETLRQVLSAEEIARAERFRLPKLRDHFITARGVLRTLLASYLHVEPASVAFCYQPQGKPAIDAKVHPQSIQFNLSHSGDWVLYAVTLQRAVGIDIESHRLTRDLNGIVNRFFSPGERAAMAALPDEQRPTAFFRYWTVKEAYLKACGTGLASPLDQFEVTLSSNAAPVIHEANGNAVQWSCQELPSEPDYNAAVVAEGSGWRLQCWQQAD
jgi:4'-phosphopantetheinyl transferase